MPQWLLNLLCKLGKILVWDDTCLYTYALPHVSVAAREAGAVASKAEHLKSANYAALKVNHHFGPFCHGNVRCAWSGNTQPCLGHWATPSLGNRGGTQQGVPPPKNRHCRPEGECCSSAWDLREAGGSLLGVTEEAPSPFTIVSLYYNYNNIMVY